MKFKELKSLLLGKKKLKINWNTKPSHFDELVVKSITENTMKTGFILREVKKEEMRLGRKLTPEEFQKIAKNIRTTSTISWSKKTNR